MAPAEGPLMATASAIIRRALRLIGAIAASETPSAAEQADALEALNAMLDSWRASSLMAYALRDETLTLTGAASYTIGTGGNLNTVRPVRIDAAYQRISDIDYPLRLASAAAWADLAAKSTTGDVADWLYYEPSHPLGRLYLYPVPSAGVLHLLTWVPLTAFAASDEVALPPGYQDALTYNLAVRLAPEYSRPVTAEVAAVARDAMGKIERVNFRPPLMSTGLEGGRRADIRSGE
jgi:hypothetical protein